MLDYLTVKEAGEKWNISGRMVTVYCNNGKIKGAVKKGNLWLIPVDAEKPLDGRTIAARKARGEHEQKTKGTGTFCWQHHGNKKSDSRYYLNNEKNTNTLS